ncbi:carboxypeptidase regulatory-like domain-containing protein [Ruania alkalisoli]|uniref:Carboxypeptidase regulatory-like domain-containing protein n=1 Tax=Ruania alkalisoli TaxID=2779775 RepID=A0A7M1SUQ7_9MICO|nr:carboxypeptidase-like regulatory domain-containing protein [Ruania alkalisoli]QOR70353.1 carboxypeptidase regulatory-like domain-containing protein [Ruania alkalisoli]
MRIASVIDRAEIAPGSAGVIPLDVVNTSDVIDTLSVRTLGFPASVTTRSEPEALTLFPEAEGRLEVQLAFPDTFPAGRYHVTLVVQGRAAGSTEAFHDVEVTVPPRPEASISARPTLVRTRGRAIFEVTVENTGNTTLDLALRAIDTDRSLRTSIAPATLSIPIAGTAVTAVTARGPRQLLGTDQDRPFRVVAEAEGTSTDVTLTLRQRPVFGRGVITMLVLMAILAAWAVAMLVGMREVLGTDPPTRVAPASFFAASPEEGGSVDAAGGTGSAEGAGAADPATGAAPAGAVNKDGLLPVGVGATITGTVHGADDPAGVGRLNVEALRESADGLVLVSSAASQSDGTYTLSGLFPGEYLVRVSSPGYETAWHPSSTEESTATPVQASAQEVTDGVDLVVTGDPASIAGSVSTGDVDDIEVTVTATPTWAAEDLPPVEVQTDGEGRYELTGLVAPGTYDLTFTADGYQPTSITETVLGGQERLALDVALGTGAGTIAGTVTDGTGGTDGNAGLGGVDVSTTLDGEEIVVGTPTIGQVGSFVIAGLPTPGTYVLTVSKDGYGTESVVVDLGAGESNTGVNVALSGGAGTITGHVVDESGRGVGGVEVSAGGASTTTLTAGDVGAFVLPGVQGRATVTLTFAREGYVSASTPVDMTQAPPSGIEVTLAELYGTIQGQVTDSDGGVAGVHVEATDGSHVYRTTSTASGSAGRGSYLLPDLPPGSYTVSLVRDQVAVTTAIVDVEQGASAVQDLPLPEGS